MGILDKKHWDWPWPFNKISRRSTAFFWGVPSLVWGNLRPQDYILQSYVITSPLDVHTAFVPKPISSPNTWQISRFKAGPWFAWYVAYSGSKQADGMYRHWRTGARWDDVDNYTQFPSVATRRFTGHPDQDTSTK